MEARSREDLWKRKQELDTALAQVRREERRAKQRDKDAQKSQRTAWKMSTNLLHTVLIIYALAGYTAEPAVKYLVNSGRKRHWPEKSEEEVAAMVEDCFLQVDVDDLACLTDKADPSDATAMKAALKYVEEWRLVVWARGLNSEQGVAPSTDSVLRRLENNRLSLPEAVRPDAVGTSAQSKARVWAQKWRLRWGARHRKIRLREDIPLPEMRSKAGAQKQNMCF